VRARRGHFVAFGNNIFFFQPRRGHFLAFGRLSSVAFLNKNTPS
jgi:hypothetical protein